MSGLNSPEKMSFVEFQDHVRGTAKRFPSYQIFDFQYVTLPIKRWRTCYTTYKEAYNYNGGLAGIVNAARSLRRAAIVTARLKVVALNTQEKK